MTYHINDGGQSDHAELTLTNDLNMRYRNLIRETITRCTYLNLWYKLPAGCVSFFFTSTHQTVKDRPIFRHSSFRESELAVSRRLGRMGAILSWPIVRLIACHFIRHVKHTSINAKFEQRYCRQLPAAKTRNRKNSEFFCPRSVSEKSATPHNLQKWDRTAPSPMTDFGHFSANNHDTKNPIVSKYSPRPRARYCRAPRRSCRISFGGGVPSSR